MLLSIVVGVCLWGQALLDQSQIWIGFAVYWTLICGMWAALRQCAKWIRSDGKEHGGGMIATSILGFGLIGAMAITQGGSLFHVLPFYEKATPTVALAQMASSKFENGHFTFAAKINERSVDMMVDTGASLVLLTHEDALKVGIDTDRLSFSTPVMTANGDSFIAKTTLPIVQVAGVEVAHVAAAVAKPGQLHRSLLGMSFITSIDQVLIEGDRMTFRN